MLRTFSFTMMLLMCGILIGCNTVEAPSNSSQGQSNGISQPSAVDQPTQEARTNSDMAPPAAPVNRSSPKNKVNPGSAPAFADYPVTDVFEGKTAPLIFTSESRTFRSRFGAAAKDSPNFAGKYIVTTWGCGTDCLMGGVIDAKTGDTFMIPFSICCILEASDGDRQKVETRKDSRLIIFNGLLNEKESETKRHYYLFENNKFARVPEGK
jgi:hypothetical protein